MAISRFLCCARNFCLGSKGAWKRYFKSYYRMRITLKAAGLYLLGLVATAGCEATPAQKPGAAAPTVAARPAPSPYLFPIKSDYQTEKQPKRFDILADEDDPDPAVHYSTLVPLSWVQKKLPWRPLTDENPMQKQVYMEAPAGSAGKLTVLLVWMTEEITPLDLLLTNFATNGERIVQQRSTPSPGGAIPDVLSLRGAPGKERISRWTVLKNATMKTGGACFFVVCITAPVQEYDAAMANTFYLATNRVTVLHPAAWPYAGPLQTLARTTPTRFSTAYPASWQHEEDPLNNDGFFRVQLTKQHKDRQVARINLTVVASQRADDIERLEAEAQNKNTLEGLEFEQSPFKAAPDFGGLRHVQVSSARQTNAGPGPRQERHVVVGQAGSYRFYGEAIYFTFDAAPDENAISKRAFDILQQRLKITP